MHSKPGSEVRFLSSAEKQQWSRRGVGRPRRPVTAKITGSNPAETAKANVYYNMQNTPKTGIMHNIVCKQ